MQRPRPKTPRRVHGPFHRLVEADLRMRPHPGDAIQPPWPREERADVLRALQQGRRRNSPKRAEAVRFARRHLRCCAVPRRQPFGPYHRRWCADCQGCDRAQWAWRLRTAGTARTMCEAEGTPSPRAPLDESELAANHHLRAPWFRRRRPLDPAPTGRPAAEVAHGPRLSGHGGGRSSSPESRRPHAHVPQTAGARKATCACVAGPPLGRWPETAATNEPCCSTRALRRARVRSVPREDKGRSPPTRSQTIHSDENAPLLASGSSDSRSGRPYRRGTAGSTRLSIAW